MCFPAVITDTIESQAALREDVFSVFDNITKIMVFF